MRQRALHRRKNTRPCQWIHKSSTVHMDTLCDHMFHALLISLTLYCSAHLLICLTHDDKPTHTHSLCFMLSEHGMSKQVQWALSLQGEGQWRLWFVWDDDVTVFLCSGWCRVTAATFLTLTLSLSHIHMFTHSCTRTLSNTRTQTFVSTEETPPSTLCCPPSPVRGRSAIPSYI